MGENEQSFGNSVREIKSAVVVVFDSYGCLPMFLEYRSGIVSLAVASFLVRE